MTAPLQLSKMPSLDLNIGERSPQHPSSLNALGSYAPSTIRIQLPNFDRFSKREPSFIKDYTHGDSLLEKEEREIEVSQVFAWTLLLLNVLSTAMVPCWLMSDVKFQPLTRNSWRFLVLSIITLPFVAYEKRRIAALGGNILDVLDIELFRMNFICSINCCIWFLIIIYAINFTSMTHAFTLVNLKFFISVLIKLKKKESHHQFETAGTILVSIGVFSMFYDSFTGEVVPHSPSNELYLSYSNLSRVFGDCLALFGSIVSVYLDQAYQIPASPRFLNLFLYNFFISFNFISFGYFFGGSELSFNEYYGVFGILDGQNFVNICYVAIMLGLNLMLSNILINQIFSQFILKIANSFLTLLTSMLYHVFNLELTASGYTYLSFGFIVPGLILILSGQNALNNNEIKIDYVIYRPAEPNPNQSASFELQELNLIQRCSDKPFLPLNRHASYENASIKLVVSE